LKSLASDWCGGASAATPSLLPTPTIRTFRLARPDGVPVPHEALVRAVAGGAHDLHGTCPVQVLTQGNSTNNAHLVNFDTRFVTPSSGGILRYDSQGANKGRCYLTCHGQNHNPESY
jgi:hypothetical protein